MNQLEKRLEELYEKKKEYYPIKTAWDPSKKHDYAVFCAREMIIIWNEAKKDFPYGALITSESTDSNGKKTVIRSKTQMEVYDWLVNCFSDSAVK